MPVNKLRGVRFIDYIYGHRHAFAHSQQGAGRRPVVTDRADDAIRHEFQCDGGNR